MSPLKRLDLARFSGLVIVLCLALLSAWLIYDDHRDTLAHNDVLMSSLARSADEQVSGGLRVIDLALRELAHKYLEGWPPEDLDAFMRTRTRFMSEVRTVLLTNERGVVVATTLPDVMGFDASGRSYFRDAMADQNAESPSISPPTQTATNTLVVFVSRAIVDAQGRFRGAVAISLSPKYFEDILGSVLPEGDGATMLANTNGTVISRIPFPERFMGFQLTGPAFIAHMQSSRKVTFHRVVTVTDKRERFSVFRQVDYSPSLIVTVSRTANEVLDPWVHRSVYHLLGLLLVSLVILYLVNLSGRRLAQAKEAEKQVSQLLSFNRSILENAPSAVFVYQADGACVFANEAAGRVVGATVEELLAQNFRSLESWRKSGLLEAARQTLETGETRRVDVDVATTFGRRIWLEGQMARFGGEESHHLLLMANDITQRREAERELHQAKEFSDRLIDTANVMVVCLDQDGRVLVFNEAAEKITGYQAEEVKGRSWFELIAPRERFPWIWESFAQVRASGEVPRTVENPILTRDGRERLISWQNSGLTDQEALVATVSFGMDVTDIRRDQEALSHSRQRLESIIAAMAEGVITQDAQGVIELVNRGALEVLGLSEEEVLGRTIMDLGLQSVHEDGSPFSGADHPAMASLRHGTPQRGVVMGLRKDSGEPTWISINSQPLYREGEDRPYAVVSSFTDITERRRWEEQLKLAARVFDETMEGIMVLDSEGQVSMVNPAFTVITGYSAEEALGSDSLVFRAASFDPAFYEKVWEDLTGRGQWSGEVLNRRKSGQVYPEWLTLSVLRDQRGRVTNYIAVFHDITEIRRGEEKIKYQAYHDSLTGLPNRALFDERLDLELARASRHGRRLAVLFLDLDHFKHINDSLGHAMGDLLLQGVAQRLRNCLREVDTVARQGGDEFVVILPEVESYQGAAQVAERFLEALAKPFQLGEQEVFVTTSVGVTIYPEDGRDRDSMVKNADLAMYRAKDLGRNNIQRFTPDMNVKAVQRLTLEHRLRKALDGDELRVYYQPKLDLAQGRLMGMEALVRWERDGTLVPPADFIPLAEETGLVVPMGERILLESCRQAALWRRHWQGEISMAVNFSARQFLQADLVDSVRRVLERTGLPPHCLEMEITESTVMANLGQATETMAALHGLGVQVAMDDFGTGYSSLYYLKQFPIGALKIDKSFIGDLPYHGDDAAIAQAIISLAHNLGLKVVAEGVETKAQLDLLRQWGCDYIQGYLVSRPLPVQEMDRYLADRPWRSLLE